MVPHQFSFQAPANVDFRLMSIFVEFYTTVLGFVNYRLYHGLNLTYPPSLPTVVVDADTDTADRVAALNQALVRTVVNDEEEVEVDNIPVTDDPAAVEEARKEAELVQNQTKLFEVRQFLAGNQLYEL